MVISDKKAVEHLLNVRLPTDCFGLLSVGGTHEYLCHEVDLLFHLELPVAIAAYRGELIEDMLTVILVRLSWQN